MDNNLNEQIEELNNLWHNIMMKNNYTDIDKKYPRLKELSKNEISIIRIISQREEVIIKEIGEIIQVPKSTLTSIMDRLEKKNLIVRAMSSRDRRSYKLELTEEGKKAQQEHVDFEYEFYGRIIKSLETYEDREEFLRLMKQISKNI